MAPSSTRRSGHSRRAQFGLFTGYVTAGVGALLGALLLGISLWRPSSFNGLRGAASDVAAAAIRPVPSTVAVDVRRPRRKPSGTARP